MKTIYSIWKVYGAIASDHSRVCSTDHHYHLVVFICQIGLRLKYGGSKCDFQALALDMHEAARFRRQISLRHSGPWLLQISAAIKAECG